MMRARLAFVGIIVAMVVPFAQGDSFPPYYTTKANTTPDFLQSDPDGAFANLGRMYCGPTAVSNSFMWLSTNGYKKLRPQNPDKKAAQIALINTLASEPYMNTSPEGGTTISELLNGIKKLVTDSGYTWRRLEYVGWEEVDDIHVHVADIPELDWIKSAISDPRSAVWLRVGYYAFSRDTGEYKRIGGHWITLVGYGVTGRNVLDPNVFIVHNPSSRSSRSPNDYITVEPISSGKLVGDRIGLPRPATGYYKLTKGIIPKKGADCCVLDGAVILVMERPTAAAN